MNLAIRLLVSIALATLALPAQTPKSMEVCGVQYRLGMTRDEVKQTFVLPTGTEAIADDLVRRDLVPLTPVQFGLPDSSMCFGLLTMNQNRVVEIAKPVAHPTDAVGLVRSLFLAVRNFSPEGKVSPALIAAWSNKLSEEQDSQSLFQTIEIGIGTSGEQAVRISAEEANWSGETALKLGSSGIKTQRDDLRCTSEAHNSEYSCSSVKLALG